MCGVLCFDCPECGTEESIVFLGIDGIATCSACDTDWILKIDIEKYKKEV